jgi:hypothetical protein
MWLNVDSESVPGLVEEFGKLVYEKGKDSNRLRIGRTCESCAHFDETSGTCKKGDRPTSPHVRCLGWTLTLDRVRLPKLEEGTDHFRLNANIQMARKLYPTTKHQETDLIVGMSCRSCRSCRGGACQNAKGPRPMAKVPSHGVCRLWKIEDAPAKLGKLRKELEALGANVTGTLWKSGGANRPKAKALEIRFQGLLDQWASERQTPEAIAQREAEKAREAEERKARRERIKADMVAGKKWKKRGLGTWELREMYEIELQVELGMTDEETDACRVAADEFETESGMDSFHSSFGLSAEYRQEANQECYFDPKAWLAAYRRGTTLKEERESRRPVEVELGSPKVILRKKAR